MTDDIKALVAKLREKPSYWHQPTYEFLHSDAADTIEALEAENSYLRGEREHGAWDTLKAKWKAAEQERDDARSANGDLLNRINELAAERDEARSQRVAQEQRAVDLAETLERARQGRDLEQLALTRAVRQIADLQQELSRLRRVAEVAATFNLGETFRELPGDREVFGS